MYTPAGISSLCRASTVLGVGSDDIDQSLVRTTLELFSGIFVLVYGTQDRNYFLLSRKRYRFRSPVLHFS